MSAKSKFTLVLVLTSLVGALVFGLLSYLDSRESLREAAFDELTAIRTARAQAVEEYFDSVGDEASVITENPTVRAALVRFRDGFAELRQADLEALAPGFEAALEDYYSQTVVPRLASHFPKGQADAPTLMPTDRVGRFLQHTYLARNPGRYGESYEALADTSDIGGGGTAYERAHAEFHQALRFIRDEFSYYDLFLIDARTGDVLYTVRKEADFATNINEGPYRSSGLGELVDTVSGDPTRRAVHFTDLSFYAPSEGKPALFVGSSIYEGNRVAGVLAIQLTVDDLNGLLTARGQWEEIGLKETGETYLVGEDRLMRNDSRFLVQDPEGYFASLAGTATAADDVERIRAKDTSILLQRVDTEGVQAALAGQTDTRVIDDYRGVSVLSAFQPLRVDGRDYALLAEMDASEAFQPVRDLALRMAVTTAIVIPLSALVGMWVAGWLMRPTSEMRDTARRFVGGDEEARFAGDRPDEWGQLGHALNDVLDTARARLRDAGEARGETETMIERLMPSAIGERYAGGERDVVSSTDAASAVVLMVNPDAAFGDLADPKASARLYGQLDDALDQLATREGVDILNQAGMNYVAFCGLTAPMANHAERLARFCRAAGAALARFDVEHGTNLSVRGGMASAPMFGALVGNYSTAYEIWGEAVERAHALVAEAQPGELVLSGAAFAGAGLDVPGEALSVLSPDGDDLAARRVPGVFGPQ